MLFFLNFISISISLLSFRLLKKKALKNLKKKRLLVSILITTFPPSFFHLDN